jgi:hypothetical protein
MKRTQTKPEYHGGGTLVAANKVVTGKKTN